MPAARRPSRYRDVPHSRAALIAFHAECDVLLRQAEALDAQQRALSIQLAEVRTQLAELRVVMWPRVDRPDFVHGFRRTHRGGPPPIPPTAPNAHPLRGRHLRNQALAVLARDNRPMTLTEIHRQIHLNGHRIESRQPVQRLADCLGYETIKGRAKRTDRGTYQVDELNPRERRKLARQRIAA
jgi:hypothetical protein